MFLLKKTESIVIIISKDTFLKKMKIKPYVIKVSLIGILTFFFLSGYTQQSSFSSSDLSTLQVDQLTDDQIQQFLKKAEDSGMTEQQLEQAAQARGMQSSEIAKLRTRIEKIQSGKGSTSDSQKFQDRSRTYKTTDESKITDKNKLSQTYKDEGVDKTDTMGIFGQLRSKKATAHIADMFGFSLFNNKKLSFEPNLNIPTPVNYQLGTDDQVIIDIWGASQQTYTEKISPDGNIIISGIGPIHLAGMTIEEGTAKLKKELGKIYAGLRGGNTFLKVSLGNVRSIKVNMIGEVYLPGTYTLPSVATVFNALYAAGGPSLHGTMRSVKVIRENKTIAELDLYEFLLKGEQKDNIRLQDQDIVFISPYTNRVIVKGEIKRPAIYDVKSNESLKDLIGFTGGFTEQAYSEQLKIFRKTSREKKVVDVASAQMDTFKMHNGDEIQVDSILNRFENRIEIKGAVYRPGVFSLGDSLTLKKLIAKAEGLRGDAFKNRAVIYRTKEDLTMEVIPVDLSVLLGPSGTDIPLQREDLVIVPSIFDIKEYYTVKVEGEVLKPGTYPYVANTTVEDIVLQSGGLLESASLARIEIARRIKNSMAETTSNQVAEIYQFQISQDLKLTDAAAKFTLQPFDQVFIRRSPGYAAQALVNVEGEVAFPGLYSIANKSERISDLVKRAGGLTPEAYVKGARLVRKLPVDEQMRKMALNRLKSQLRDTAKFEFMDDNQSAIGIDLDKILANPQTSYDLFIQEGDLLKIPKELQTVRLSGEVLYPVVARYDESRLKGYISKAGGFSPLAIKSKTYVIYANGSIDRTSKILFFNHYPKIEPGAEIVVPQKPARRALSAAETIGLGSMFASMALVIVTVINSIK
jgi:protein involved in polysaccharide export with SLBB domain